jgi:hypothetical protein
LHRLLSSNSAFDKHSLQLPLITVQWFMCVFVNTLRPEVTLRVWDMFLNEGSKVLFRIAAALFQMNERKLLAAKDASDLFGLLRNIGKDVIDADALIALAYKGYSPKPLTYKIAVGPPTVSPIPSARKVAEGGSGGKTASGRSVSVGSVSEVANPRLRGSNKQQGAVPAELIGIGLAHIGPDKCPDSPVPRTDAYEENLAYIDAVGTIGEPTGNSSRANSSDSSVGTPTKNSGVAFAFGNTLLSRTSGSGQEFRSPVKERKDSVESRGSFSSTSGRPRSIRQFTPLQVSSEQLSYEAYMLQYPQKAPGVRKKGKSTVLNFHRADIALWRSSFRPALEEQYRVMEEARQEWKREASMSRYSNIELRKSDVTPAAAPAASAAPVVSVPPTSPTTSRRLQEERAKQALEATVTTISAATVDSVEGVK